MRTGRRDIPRTATAIAIRETRLLALERGDFLDAVTGSAVSWRTADELVAERLSS